MSEPLYLSRARLCQNASLSALAPLLVPEKDDDRVATGHRLIWSLFADGPDRERDFLWREAKPGLFYLLSRREPKDAHNLFELAPPKLFEPSLKPGDRLHFSLRANPTVARIKEELRTKNRPATKPPRHKTAHDDVVMHALHEIPAGPERAANRFALIEKEGLAWLARQGQKSGFTPDTDYVRIDNYRTLSPPKRNARMRIGLLDYEGMLTVEDPARFLDAVATGFGRAKAYGCGLMLIRRA